jgi:GTP cyclohydrolase I
VQFRDEEDLARVLLMSCAGLEPDRPQHARTPARFVKALKELTTPDDDWEFTTFDTMNNEMVILRDIQFASLCEHHIFPFYGVCHVAYVPDGKLAGLSKIPRLVKQCSAMLNTQEDLTAYIANRLQEFLEPRGVGVMMEAEHTCMAIRGVQAFGTKTYTAAMYGVFGDHTKTAKAEFMSRVNGR